MAHTNRQDRITAALVAAVILAALFCRLFVYSPWNVTSFGDKLANYVRIFLYLGLFTVWGISVSRRVMQVQVKRYLIAVAALMVLWLTLREFRWHLVTDPRALRWLWYSYYVFTLLIPLLALLVSLSLGKWESYRLPRWTTLLYLPTGGLILLALTNDLHQLVFRFPAGARVWTEADYRYGPGFYVLTAWGVLCGLGAFAVMLTKCRLPRTRRFLWLPLVPVGGFVLYVALYALRRPLPLALGDVTVVECLLFTGFFESCIQVGLIQSNTRYAQLFRASEGISAQITDREYRVLYAASAAGDIPLADMAGAEGGPVLLPGGRQLHNMPIRGGHAIWTEDISRLLELRETLEDRQEELQERNGLLRYEYDREREHQVVAEQNRLYDLLQSRTQTQLDEIGALAEEYRRSEDEGEKKRILSHIVVLGSFIKRRKDFVLSLDASPTIPEARLSSALAESFRALALLGVRGGYLVRTGRDFLPGEVLTTAYDFFEDVTEALLDRAAALNVRVCPVGGVLRVSILADRPAEAGPLLRKYPRMEVSSEEDGETAFLLPLEGGEDP